MQTGLRVLRVDGIRLLHALSAFTQRTRHNFSSVDVLKAFVIRVRIEVLTGVPGFLSEVCSITVYDSFKQIRVVLCVGIVKVCDRYGYDLNL